MRANGVQEVDVCVCVCVCEGGCAASAQVWSMHRRVPVCAEQEQEQQQQQQQQQQHSLFVHNAKGERGAISPGCVERDVVQRNGNRLHLPQRRAAVQWVDVCGLCEFERVCGR